MREPRLPACLPACLPARLLVSGHRVLVRGPALEPCSSAPPPPCALLARSPRAPLRARPGRSLPPWQVEAQQVAVDAAQDALEAALEGKQGAERGLARCDGERWGGGRGGQRLG